MISMSESSLIGVGGICFSAGIDERAVFEGIGPVATTSTSESESADGFRPRFELNDIAEAGGR